MREVGAIILETLDPAADLPALRAAHAASCWPAGRSTRRSRMAHRVRTDRSSSSTTRWCSTSSALLRDRDDDHAATSAC